jgi:uncharacterized membrane protein SpoIIM required for sporulation
MVLEALTSPMKAEHRPWQMLFLGFLYSSVGILLSLWVFYQYASLTMVFLTVFACMPIVYNTVKLEEKKDEIESNEVVLLKEHWKALEVFMFLFIGITISIVVWYVFLPEKHLAVLFATQSETFHSINSAATGLATGIRGFTDIFLHNLKVLLFCILFSFVYGLGAIFILAWNASVIGLAIGMIIRKGLASAAGTAGFAKVAAYFNVWTYGLLRYSLHGLLEIFAYFVGGLAGGIISVAVIRHTIGTKRFENILWDSTDLLVIALLTLLVAAAVEVYVTPMVFS